ncbi:MAG: polyprenol monophosphomannose synthase [Candidatus Gastranaerophilales bacterium]|nr:polyprenol monophosphomannose synthase [Candidatus Gastranaerophilales bacterium]
MNKIIIIPTYNEEENIEKIILEIQKLNCPLLVVDDNSADKTREIVGKYVDDKNIFILKRAGKMGLASAYIDGFRFAIQKGFDCFVEMDADFSHNPKYLPTMFKELEENDVVIGSRNVKDGGVLGWSFLRNFISKGGSIYSQIVLNCPIKDLTGGFNGWKKEVLDAIGLENIISKGYCFQIEMKYRAFKKGFKIKEFPIIFEDRKFGKSKMNKAIFFEALLNVLKIRFNIRKGV